jgi:hypothetical protein
MTRNNLAISRAEAKVFCISAVVLSTTVCSVAFWYGVYGTIFFTYLLNVWVVATSALLASLFLPKMEMPLATMPWRGRFLLALPTLWLALSAFVGTQTYRPDSPGTWMLWAATLLSAFLTLPYLLHVVIVAVVPDIDRLKHPKLRVALLGIVLAMAFAGFAIGKNHPIFLTCENFKLGGHDIPANCRMGIAEG